MSSPSADIVEKHSRLTSGASYYSYCAYVSRTESGGTEVKDNREKLHSVPE